MKGVVKNKSDSWALFSHLNSPRLGLIPHKARFKAHGPAGEPRASAEAALVGSWWNGDTIQWNIIRTWAQTNFHIPFLVKGKKKKENNTSEWGRGHVVREMWSTGWNNPSSVTKQPFPKIIRWQELRVCTGEDLQDFITWEQRRVNHSLGTHEHNGKGRTRERLMCGNGCNNVQRCEY